MLSILHQYGHITHIPQDAYSDASTTPKQAIATAAKTLGMVETDWVLCVDMDDFLIIHLDGGTLPDLTSQIPDSTGLSLSRRYFGNNGLVDPSQTPFFKPILEARPRSSIARSQTTCPPICTVSPIQSLPHGWTDRAAR